MNKKSIIFIALSLVAALSITTVYAINRSKKEIQVERQSLIEKFDKNIESVPNNKTLNERVNESNKFKDDLQKLANEEANLGLDKIDNSQKLKTLIEDNEELVNSKIKFYESSTYLLNNQKSKNAYEDAKKRSEFLKNLKEEFSSGKINANDGLNKFEKIKEMN